MSRDLSKQNAGIAQAFNDHRRRLQGIARRSGGQDAEDVVQDAFLKVVETARQQEILAPDRLLSRIARCVAIDRLRRRTARATFTQSDVGEGMADAGVDPERALIGSQRLRRVLAAIDSMPPRRREVFLLHRMDDLTYAQIAQRTGTSVKSVEKHIRLALQDLFKIEA